MYQHEKQPHTVAQGGMSSPSGLNLQYPHDKNGKEIEHT